MTQSTDTPRPREHVHSWRDTATVRQHRIDHSPVSHADCYVRDEVVLTQSCECGEFRRIGIGTENAKRGH